MPITCHSLNDLLFLDTQKWRVILWAWWWKISEDVFFSVMLISYNRWLRCYWKSHSYRSCSGTSSRYTHPFSEVSLNWPSLWGWNMPLERSSFVLSGTEKMINFGAFPNYNCGTPKCATQATLHIKSVMLARGGCKLDVKLLRTWLLQSTKNLGHIVSTLSSCFTSRGIPLWCEIWGGRGCGCHATTTHSTAASSGNLHIERRV